MPHSTELKQILVVDDDATILSLIKAILKKSSYEVTTSESGEDALKKVKLSHFDCVITDAVMPGMDGYTFIQNVRSDTTLAHLPILMLTAKRLRTDMKRAAQAGATDYIVKPIDERLLLEKLDLYVRRPQAKVGGVVKSKDIRIDAEIRLRIQITEIDAQSVTLRVSSAIDYRSPFFLHSPLFKELDIAPMSVELQSCQAVSGSDDFPYEARVRLLEPATAQVQRIRDWLNSHRAPSK